MKVKNYLGFYLKNLFWVENSPDMTQLGEEELSSLMAEIAVEFETDEIEIRVCNDGMFQLRVKSFNDIDFSSERDFELLDKVWGDYLDYANAISLLFESNCLKFIKLGFIETTEQSNKSAFSVRYEDGNWKGESIAAGTMAHYYQMGRFASQIPSYPDLRLDWRFSNRVVVPRKVFDNLFEFLDKNSKNIELIQTLSEFLKAISEYKISNYRTSFTLSWFLIEGFIRKEFNLFLDEKKKEDESSRITSSREKELENYNLGTMLNILELSDEINLSRYREVNELKKIRNKVVHQKNKTVPADIAKTALELVKELIFEDLGCNLKINLSRSLGSI